MPMIRTRWRRPSPTFDESDVGMKMANQQYEELFAEVEKLTALKAGGKSRLRKGVCELRPMR